MLVFLLFVFASCQKSICSLGNYSASGFPITFSELLAHPSLYANTLVRIDNPVLVTAFDTNGLYLQLSGGGDPYATPVVVLLHADRKWFSFPVDLSQKSEIYVKNLLAEVQLTTFVSTDFPLSQLSNQVVLKAVGLTLVSNYSAICHSWTNQVQIRNLGGGQEIEGNSIGAGMVCLDYMEIEPLHSTEHSTEVVNCFQNCVVLRLKRGSVFEEHELCKGHSAMIPSATPHMLINRVPGTSTCYVYVHAVVDTELGH